MAFNPAIQTDRYVNSYTLKVPMRVGLFGGTFDPPHLGHLVTAVNVRHVLKLDLVVLMVANDPWQKHGIREVASATDRLAMVQAAIAGVDGLIAGDDEITRGGPSFTADTLQMLRERYSDSELFTIVGDDAAAKFGTWQRANEISKLSTLVVVDRPGSPITPPSEYKWNRVEVPRLEVSSSDLRARFVDGRPLEYLISDEVMQVISVRGLYGSKK
jgi:nicotinate-nucleotide adenylyltransferase